MAKILVIEDYASQQYIYETILEKDGHQVDIAEDGRIAVEMAKAKHYDLILLDMLLQHVNGIDFLKGLDLKRHPGPPVIAFSNISNPKIIQEALDLGLTSYFTKAHYTPQEVLDCVNDVLAGKTPPMKPAE